MNEHPSNDIRGTLGTSLAGKTIVLGITGSVAAVRSCDIARFLIRHGADVWPVMTKAACELIHPHLMEWATGHKPIVELTGAIEHVALVGNVPVHADLLLIAPATANTVGKIAAGIDDSPVTTFVTTAFGQGIPLVVVPAMHQSMYQHPFVIENLAKLEKAGIRLVMPRVEEGKAKIPDEAQIYQEVHRILNPYRPLAGKKVFITAGRTVEYLDPIRVLTNNSTGRMGVSLARAALALGAEVTVLAGKLSVEVPPGCRVVPTESAQELFEACQALVTQEKPEVFVAAAAVGDWRPVQASAVKIPTSAGRLTLELEPTPKVLDQVKSWSPRTFLVAFRAQSGLSDEELAADASARLTKAQADLIAANHTTRPGEGFESLTNALTVLDRSGAAEHIPLQSKEKVAEKLLALILKRL